MNRECSTPAIASRLTIRLSHRSTMGPALETFRRVRALSRAELASWLSVDEAGLDRMAELPRPDPDEADFPIQCRAIARTTSGDAFAVRTMLRWLRSNF